MNESESTLMIYFYSETEDVSLGFGISCDPETDSIESLDTNWICEVMSEAFWENHKDFESGIEKATIIAENNPEITQRDALIKIFGDFIASYEFDRQETELHLDIDVNKLMYDLLES